VAIVDRVNACVECTLTTSVRLSPETAARLEQVAARTGQSPNVVLNRLVEEHLDDLLEADLAEKAWKEHLASGEPTITLEQLERDLGLDR